MPQSESTGQSRQREDRLRAWLPVNLSLLLWTITGITVTALSLRFGMRAVGIREDIPLPGRIYTLTAPMVEPLYGIFPVSDRFDYPAIEFASLAAVGAVLTLALLVYVLGLITASGKRNSDS
ncbi:MAG: hypothetical protein ABIO92_05105 [Chloroflexia bacterium]